MKNILLVLGILVILFSIISIVNDVGLINTEIITGSTVKDIKPVLIFPYITLILVIILFTILIIEVMRSQSPPPKP